MTALPLIEGVSIEMMINRAGCAASDSLMRHVPWTCFHLKKPIRPIDLPSHQMPIRLRAQTKTPRTLLSFGVLQKTVEQFLPFKCFIT